MRHAYVFLAIALLLLALAGCSEDPAAPPPGPPHVSDITVALNPYNSLSTVVTARVGNAATVRVSYRDPSGGLGTTPDYAVNGNSVRIVTLGLRDTTSYEHTLHVTGPGGSVESAPVVFGTGALPDTLRAVRLTTTGQSSGGYTLTAASDLGFAVAFDGDGRIAWYREIPGFVARQVTQLENGNFAAFVGWTTGSQQTDGEYVEFRADGAMIASYKPPAPLYMDGHEFLATVSNGVVTHAHYFSYYHEVIDMSAFGGPVDALVAGHQIQRMRSDGVLEFTWDAWRFFSLDDWIEEPASIKQNAVSDFDHPNSLHIDTDGNYVVSWRHLAEVNKIHSGNGAIMWRLGGRNNQFTFIQDTFGGFNGQHSAVILDDGNLLLYDNGLRHTPPESRAVEYELDTQAMTARQVWEFRHEPPLYTPFVGSVQRLQNGNTVVGFGGAGTVTEVDPSGTVVWEGELFVENVSAQFYRGRRILSLYAYAKP